MKDRCQRAAVFFCHGGWKEVPALELPKMREVRQFDSKLHMNGENAENFFEMERWFDKHFRHAFL